MKIALSATSSDPEGEVDPRFGRCACFMLYDTDSEEFEAVDNVHAGGSGGVGIAAAQMMIDKGVEAVLTGQMGPNASRVFSAAGIPVTTGVSGMIREAARAYAPEGGPGPASAATDDAQTAGPAKPGLGLRRGATRGMGSGGGRGGGRGRGAGPGMAWRRGGGGGRGGGTPRGGRGDGRSG